MHYRILIFYHIKKRNTNKKYKIAKICVKTLNNKRKTKCYVTLFFCKSKKTEHSCCFSIDLNLKAHFICVFQASIHFYFTCVSIKKIKQRRRIYYLIIKSHRSILLSVAPKNFNTHK